MSAKELNIGDYVRTKYGIAKIESFELKNKKMINLDKDIMLCNMDIYRNHCSINQVIKSSSNIIDLIEVGDYVNGYKVMDFEDKYTVIDEKIDDFVEKEGKFIVLGNEEGHYGVPEEGIKSIVTKEQFESMEYKIGE